jgi:hypothetical protein
MWWLYRHRFRSQFARTALVLCSGGHSRHHDRSRASPLVHWEVISERG